MTPVLETKGESVRDSTMGPTRAQTSAGSYSKTLLYLSLAAGGLGTISALAGLLWQGSGDSFTFATLRGDAVELYGRGLYENDTLFVAGNNFSSDLVMLLLAVPLLAISLRMYLRGSLRGHLLLLGALGYFLYYGVSYALGAVAFNELFLVYVALFSASLFGVVVAFASFDVRGFAARWPVSVPRRWPGIFMLASGVVTLAIWLVEPVGSLLSGELPESLETHTTLFTNAFDVAVIVPAAIFAGVQILRRRPLGYVVAFSLLVTEALLMPSITIATIRQVQLGLSFTPGEVVGPIAGFSVFALLALWVLVALLRTVSEAPGKGRAQTTA